MTLLYAAFAVVALWLLGELLLQRRAPLPWRALALAGFLGLVGGVAMGSLPLIGGGVLGFGAGQYLASRALKAPGGPYWSLVPPERVPVVGRLFGAAAAGPVAVAAPEPVVVGEVSAVESVAAVEATAVFQAEEYQVEGDSVYYGYGEQEQQAAYYGYATEQGAYVQQPQEYAYAEYYGQYQDPQQGYQQAQPDYQQQYAAAYQPQPDQQQYAEYQQPYPEYQQPVEYPYQAAYPQQPEYAQYHYPESQP
ncbi:hypothetical protein [Streptacidiphilus rugosus]|uniref:hypothetical protein n=1 Tax=Streptacidiphilus rugosus TaxID=405783 RepID=UPI000690D5F4|nr:hypothetical protein [Streptacidiphilus rugosus]